jgi:hypothetical protein
VDVRSKKMKCKLVHKIKKHLCKIRSEIEGECFKIIFFFILKFIFNIDMIKKHKTEYFFKKKSQILVKTWCILVGVVMVFFFKVQSF